MIELFSESSTIVRSFCVMDAITEGIASMVFEKDSHPSVEVAITL